MGQLFTVVFFSLRQHKSVLLTFQQRKGIESQFWRNIVSDVDPYAQQSEMH
jgi:hypothetical protein